MFKEVHEQQLKQMSDQMTEQSTQALGLYAPAIDRGHIGTAIQISISFRADALEVLLAPAPQKAHTQRGWGLGNLPTQPTDALRECSRRQDGQGPGLSKHPQKVWHFARPRTASPIVSRQYQGLLESGEDRRVTTVTTTVTPQAKTAGPTSLLICIAPLGKLSTTTLG